MLDSLEALDVNPLIMQIIAGWCFSFLFQAITEKADAIKAAKMKIFVRRGGPNYQAGLALMRSLGDKIGIDIDVFGPDNSMTGICKLAAEYVKSFDWGTETYILRGHYWLLELSRLNIPGNKTPEISGHDQQTRLRNLNKLMCLLVQCLCLLCQNLKCCFVWVNFLNTLEMQSYLQGVETIQIYIALLCMMPSSRWPVHLLLKQASACDQ